ncbi:MAG: 50S ribosomal protein L21 [Acidobacteriota bacterium]
MQAIIRSGGKQYSVVPGDIIRVDRLNHEVGAKVEFKEVLSFRDGDTFTLGAPVIESAKVVGTVIENDRSKKILVFKYKRKKQYKVTRGHRQDFTAVKIDEIVV